MRMDRQDGEDEAEDGVMCLALESQEVAVAVVVAECWILLRHQRHEWSALGKGITSEMVYLDTYGPKEVMHRNDAPHKKYECNDNVYDV